MTKKVQNTVNKIFTLSTHPLNSANLEDKCNYLKALALIMAADGKIVHEEKSYFGAVARTLVGDDSSILQTFVAYASAPDLGELQAISHSLASNIEYQQVLILDSVTLALADNLFHSSEFKVLAQLRKLVRWELPEFTYNIDSALALAGSCDEKLFSLIYQRFPKHLVNHIREFLGFRELPEKDPLSFFQFRYCRNQTLSTGKISGGDRILTKPITYAQILPFLQYQQYIGHLSQKGMVLKIGETTFMELVDNEISLKSTSIEIDNSKKNKPLKMISPLGAAAYAEWLSLVCQDTQFRIPTVTTDKYGRIIMPSRFENQCILVRRGKQYYQLGPKHKNVPTYTILSEEHIVSEKCTSHQAHLYLMMSTEKKVNSTMACNDQLGQFLQVLKNHLAKRA